MLCSTHEAARQSNSCAHSWPIDPGSWNGIVESAIELDARTSSRRYDQRSIQVVAGNHPVPSPVRMAGDAYGPPDPKPARITGREPATLKPWEVGGTEETVEIPSADSDEHPVIVADGDVERLVSPRTTLSPGSDMHCAGSGVSMSTAWNTPLSVAAILNCTTS